MTDSFNPADFGVSSMAAPLTRVAMRRPGTALRNADAQQWHYAKTLNPQRLNQQYQHFVDLITAAGCEILWLPAAEDALADSIFTYDPSFMTPEGAVLLQPAKPLRSGEIDLHRDFYHAHNIPIIGAVESPAQIEGGDCFWLDSNTLAVGCGFRTNRSGMAELKKMLTPYNIEVYGFDLPVYKGSAACLHLMSVVSPLDDNLALVYAPLMPATLYQLMLEMGYELITAPEDEFVASLGLNLNVLATAPRQCIAIDGFPKTQALLQAAGCTVSTFIADELCIPCEGGPTCLTRPIKRESPYTPIFIY